MEQISDDYAGDIIKVEPAELHDLKDGDNHHQQQRFEYTKEEVCSIPSNYQHIQPNNDNAMMSNNHMRNDDDDTESQMQQMFLINRGTLQELYSLDMDPKRKEFLDHYLDFMKKRGSALSRVPSVGRQMLDLYKLFIIVRNLGGVHEVIQNRRWNTVRKFLGIPATLTSAAYTLKARYLKLLYAYDCNQRGCALDKNLTTMEYQSLKLELGPGSNEGRYHGNDDSSSGYHQSPYHRSPPPSQDQPRGVLIAGPPCHGDMRNAGSNEEPRRGNYSPRSHVIGNSSHERLSPESNEELDRCSMVDPKSNKALSNCSDQTDESANANLASNGITTRSAGVTDKRRSSSSRESTETLPRLASKSPISPNSESQVSIPMQRQKPNDGNSAHALESHRIEKGSIASKPHLPYPEHRLIKPTPIEHHNNDQIHHPRGIERCSTTTTSTTNSSKNHNGPNCCESPHCHRQDRSPPLGYIQRGANQPYFEHHPYNSSGQKRMYPSPEATPSTLSPAKRRINQFDEPTSVWESTCIVGFKIHRKYENKLYLTVDVNGESFTGTLTKNQ